MSDDVPQWAKERAAKLANADLRRGDSPTAAGGWTVEQVDRWTSLRAFARYIAEHEEPPVDPRLTEAMLAARKERGLLGWKEAEPLALAFRAQLEKRGLKIVDASS